MNIVEERTSVQVELDNRICSHISRGNKAVYDIISTYHMKEIAQIRDFMLDVLHTDFFYDARALNNAFHMAVSELGINLESLLKADTKVVSTKAASVRVAM